MNTSSVLLGLLLSGNIKLPRGHLNKMEDPGVLLEYSVIVEEGFDWKLPEAEITDWEAEAKESPLDNPKARIQPM
jgi:hypothetical protein